MSTPKILVLAVFSTLVATLFLVGVGLFAARAAVADEIGETLVHGFGSHGGSMFRHGGGPCARLTDEHVQAHTTHLRDWVVRELDLNEQQTAALAPVNASIVTWAQELRPICELPMSDAPAKVEAAARFAETTDRAMQRFANEFAAFYAVLDATQQARLDSALSHHHGHDDAATGSGTGS